MTGFGASNARTDAAAFKIEVRTLNSKFLDINLRLPKSLNDKELEVRSLIGKMLQRGKVNLLIEQTTSEDSLLPTEVNESLFGQYLKKFQSLAAKHELAPQDLFKIVLHSPDVLQTAELPSDEIWKHLENELAEALNKCDHHRTEEGKVLGRELENYIRGIGEKLESIENKDGQRQAHIRARLERGLAEIRNKVQVDDNRFEQELIYYLEKLDISEEKVRLKQHLAYFCQVMGEAESQGKKLGFITQEIGREINTIGSKANDVDIQKDVVEMKDELEKIKEQILNVL